MSSTSFVNSFINQMHHSLGANEKYHYYTVDNETCPEGLTVKEKPQESINAAVPQHALSRQANKIKQLARTLIGQLANVWKTFAKRALKFTKIILKSITLVVDEAQVKKIKNTLSYLGLASLIELGFDIHEMKKDSNQLSDDIRLKDSEGILWSSTNVISDFLAIVRNLVSCGDTLDKLFHIPFLALFSVVALPLSLILQTYDIIHSIYRLIFGGIELSQLPRTIEEDGDVENFIGYLDKKVGATAEEKRKIEEAVNEKYGIIKIGSSLKGDFSFVAIKMDLLQKDGKLFDDTSDIQKRAHKEIAERVELLKAKKMNKLGRRVDKKIVSYMVNARKTLAEASSREQQLIASSEARESSAQESARDTSGRASGQKALAKNMVRDLRMLNIRKLTLNSAKAVISVAGLALEILTIFLSPLAAAITTLGFSASKAGFSIFKEVYESRGMVRGLRNPHLLA